MLLVSKICAAVLLAVLRLAAGLLPLKCFRWMEQHSRDDEDTSRRKRIEMYLSIFLCFGGGLLLSTCFIHMIPEVTKPFVYVFCRNFNWIGKIGLVRLISV